MPRFWGTYFVSILCGVVGQQHSRLKSRKRWAKVEKGLSDSYLARNILEIRNNGVTYKQAQMIAHMTAGKRF